LDSSKPSHLTPLQLDLLREFFSREQRFFLTGGAALSEFYLHHRKTKDLDLFTSTPVDLDLAQHSLFEAATACGASTQVLQSFADFHRLIVRRDTDECVVDLVNDRAPAIEKEKVSFGNVRVDTLREMRANKLCAAFSRSEIRDLMFLLGETVVLKDVVADAETKDGGFNPADLAWVLSEIRVPLETKLPGQVTVDALNAFRQRLIQQLEVVAYERAHSLA
jgi:hypothetical protein